MSDTNGSVHEEAYSAVMEFFFGWHCLVANLNRSLEHCSDANDITKEIKTYRNKENKLLSEFKGKISKLLGVNLINGCLPGERGEFDEGGGDDDQPNNLKWPENVMQFLKPVGCHIHVWRKDIDLAIEQVGDLPALKREISKIPEILEEMIDDVRSDMQSTFQEIVERAGKETK